MWIEKAAENSYGLVSLFNDFLNRESYHKIEIVGKQKIAGEEEVYVVKAIHYLKDIEKTFYFGDFSVGLDLMENPYPKKQRDLLNDVSWSLILSSKLNKEDRKKYMSEAREYQINQIKENLEFVKEFYGKRKSTKTQNKQVDKEKEYQERQEKRLNKRAEIETKADMLELKYMAYLSSKKPKKSKDKDLTK